MAFAKSKSIHIDGSMGEGGGQILRTSLALSTCLGQPFTIVNIRAARQRPGLQPQHLAAVKAAAAISHAAVDGAEKDSLALSFTPSNIVTGHHHFSIGTAGSTSLVLQTILPALMLADSPSSIILEGGTHNPLAPPFDFLQQAFLPLINRMGPTIEARLERPGFAPKGGGRLCLEVNPTLKLKALEIPERGAVIRQYAEVLLAHLPEHIAHRELTVIKQALGYDDSQLKMRMIDNAYGPGNVVSVIVASEYITECFSTFGQRGLPAEQVANKVVREVRRYLNAGVPVGCYLADQLLLPLALAGHGMYMTLEPSRHLLTNMGVINAFMNIKIRAQELEHDIWKISL